MVTLEKPAVNGAELIDRLAQTGTGDNKLALPRALLGYHHRKEHRVARPDELIDAMEKAGRFAGYEQWPETPPLTLEKARAIAATGVWSPALRPAAVPVEQLILAGGTVPEPAAPEAAVEMAEELGADEPAGELPPVGPAPVKKKPGGKKKPNQKAARPSLDAPPVPVPAVPA
jgi:hypothetical protein